MLPVIYKLDKDREFKLGFKAIARLEKIFEKTTSQWNMKDLSFEEVANILTEANRKEDPNISVDKLMDLIDEYSDSREAYKKAYECIAEAFGKNETAVEEAPQETKEQSGTGA